MAKESESEGDLKEAKDKSSERDLDRPMRTRSANKKSAIKVKDRSSSSEEDKLSDSQHNSPISCSGSLNNNRGGRVEVNGVKQSRRIKKKSKKVLEAEMNIHNSRQSDSRSRISSKNVRKSQIK